MSSLELDYCLFPFLSVNLFLPFITLICFIFSLLLSVIFCYWMLPVRFMIDILCVILNLYLFSLFWTRTYFYSFSPQSCPNLHTVQFSDRNTLWYEIKLCYLYFPIAATKINVKTICPFFCWLKTRSGGDVSLQPVMWVCLLSFSHLLFPLSSFSSVCPLLWSSLVLSLSPYKTSLYSPSCLSSRPVSQRWSSPHFLLISKQCHLFVTLSPQQPL